MLARWRSAGLLSRDLSTGLHLLEARVVGPQRTVLPDPPVRYLLGKLPPATQLETLESTPDAAAATELDPAVVLVDDPEGAFRGVLDEASMSAERLVETRIDGHLVQLSRIPQGGLTRRIHATLDASALRTLQPPSESERQLAAFVSLSEPGLHLLPIHRGVRHWPTFREDTFLRLVAEYLRIYPLAEPLTTATGLEQAREKLASLASGHHAMLAVLPAGRGVILRVRQGIDLGHIPAVPRNPTLRSLDLSLLDALVLRTVMGIKDPEAPDHAHVVPVGSVDALVEQVERGVLQVGFALNPPPVWEVRAVMQARATLPRDTFRLEPAPPSGFVFVDPHP